MIAVLDNGRPLEFSFDDMLKYHGPGSPGGVAHAYLVMRRAFARLCPETPPIRQDIRIETCFKGPGARDGFEMVTRAVTSGRYIVNPVNPKHYPDVGSCSRYVFRVFHGDDMVELMIRPGMVREEFLELGGKQNRSNDEEIHLAWLKDEMTKRLMKLHPSAVYDIIGG